MTTAPAAPTPAQRPAPASAPPRAPGPAGPLSATLCRDPARFAALGPRWDALRARSRAATPFQSHAWLDSWWQSYGRPGRLRVVLVHAGDDLVAAAPLMLVHRPLPALVPLGGGITDFSDVLLDEDHPRAPAALARALQRASRGAVLDLREVRPGAAAERLYEAWAGPRRRLADSVCLELPGVPIEELLTRLAPASAKRTRQKLRKMDQMGVEEHTVAAPDVPSAVRTMLRLHALQWEGRGVTPEHLHPRFAAHLERAVRRMVRDGDALVTAYRFGGETMACDITFTAAGLVCGYLYGAHPRLREQRVDIATMLLRHDARYAAAHGGATLSLLRGTEPYKLRWQPETVANQRFLLARRELAPALALHAAQAAGRALAAELVRDRAATAGAVRDRVAPVLRRAGVPARLLGDGPRRAAAPAEGS